MEWRNSWRECTQQLKVYKMKITLQASVSGILLLGGRETEVPKDKEENNKNKDPYSSKKKKKKKEKKKN